MPVRTKSHPSYPDRGCSPESSYVSFQTVPNSRNLHDYSESGKAIGTAAFSDDSGAAGRWCSPTFFLFFRTRKPHRTPGASASYTPFRSKGVSNEFALEHHAPAIPGHAPETITMFGERNRSPQICCTPVEWLAGRGDPDLSQDAVGRFLQIPPVLKRSTLLAWPSLDVLPRTVDARDPVRIHSSSPSIPKVIDRCFAEACTRSLGRSIPCPPPDILQPVVATRDCCAQIATLRGLQRLPPPPCIPGRPSVQNRSASPFRKRTVLGLHPRSRFRANPVVVVDLQLRTAITDFLSFV